jgi:tryptophanase
VYTQSHLDYLVAVIEQINARRKSVKGYRFTYAPELLRHFTARFEPV